MGGGISGGRDRIIRIDSDDTVTTLVVLADTKIDELVSAQQR